MAFSTEWEERYRENTHLSVWPWSDLVSYVMRYARPRSEEFRVLELGCGAGANIPFFVQLGVQYYAIEGSQTIVKKIWKKYPDLKDNIIVGDFVKEIPFSDSFDLVIDRGSLTCNSTYDIEVALAGVYNKMKTGGKFIGIDWYSTEHSDFRKGSIKVDTNSLKGFEEGHLANVGLVHFSDKDHLKKLFKDFQFEIMEHKIIKKEIPADEHTFASWNLVAIKEE